MGAASRVHIDEALWQRGWDLFIKRPDKEWGLTDCISFVVMQECVVLRALVTSNWTEREFAQYHSRIASRLKAAVHVHITAPDARGKIGRRRAL